MQVDGGGLTSFTAPHRRRPIVGRPLPLALPRYQAGLANHWVKRPRNSGDVSQRPRCAGALAMRTLPIMQVRDVPGQRPSESQAISHRGPMPAAPMPSGVPTRHILSARLR